MAASRTKSVRMSHALFEAIDLIAKQQGYPSANALFEAMARYTAFTQPSHKVTLPLASLPPEVQDEIDEAARILVICGKGMTAEQLKKLMPEEIIARAAKAKADNPHLFP